MVLSLDQLAATAPGSNLGNLGDNLARSALNSFCEVYNSYPGWAASPAFQGGFVTKAFLDNACRRSQKLPNSPLPPDGFQSGGFCSGLRYEVRITAQGTRDDGQPANGEFGWTLESTGPMAWQDVSFSSTDIFGKTTWNARARITELGGQQRSIIAVLENLRERADLQVAFRRMDGQTDNCTPIPPTVPTDAPPPEALYRPVPVPSPRGGNPIVVPVIIPLKPVIAPTLQVQIGEININFNLDNTINFSPTINLPPFPTDRPTEPQPPGNPFPPFPPTRPNPTPPNSGSCPDPCPDTDLSPVLRVLEEIKDCACDGETRLVTRLLGSGDSGTYPLPTGTYAVRLSLSRIPARVKGQSGGGNAPDVAICGWSAFGFGDFFGDRTQISYASNAYPVPVGCDSFSYTVYNGAIATITALIKEEI